MRPNLALVTGATSGIGETFIHFLARKGIPLLITGRNQEKLTSLSHELDSVESIVCDLSCEREKLIEVIQKRKPDLVINNAGMGLYGEALSHPVEKQLEILRVNSEAVFHLTLEAAKALITAHRMGTILNVSSAAAFQTFPLFASYAASKACVNSFSGALDIEFRDRGVRVLTACPGMVDTSFRVRAGGHPVKKKGFLLLSPEKVVKLMWNQIQNGKPLQIIDWKYALSTFLTNTLLPKSWVIKLLMKNIRSRLEK